MKTYHVFRLPNSICYVPATSPTQAREILVRYCYPQALVAQWPLLSSYETEKEAEDACLTK